MAKLLMQDDPKWFQFLIDNDKEPCPTGKPSTAFIKRVFSHTTFGIPKITPPACAATLCCALEENKIKSPHSARAKDFSKWGVDVTGLDLKGSIVVIRHANGHFHVTTFEKWVDKSNGIVILRGGNQGHKVCAAQYNVSGNKNNHDEIIAWRWPKETL
jgi:hypothetical protein